MFSYHFARPWKQPNWDVVSVAVWEKNGWLQDTSRSSTLYQGESLTLHIADNTVKTTPSFTVNQRKPSSGQWLQTANKYKNINYKYAPRINVKKKSCYILIRGMIRPVCGFYQPPILRERGKKRFFVLTCWCSEPALPPEGYREPQANGFDFIWRFSLWFNHTGWFVKKMSHPCWDHVPDWLKDNHPKCVIVWAALPPNSHGKQQSKKTKIKDSEGCLDTMLCRSSGNYRLLKMGAEVALIWHIGENFVKTFFVRASPEVCLVCIPKLARGGLTRCEALGAAGSCARHHWKAGAGCSSDAPPSGCWGTRSCSGPGCSRSLWSGRR